MQVIDLRDFPYIPLYIHRLQKSRAWLQCKREPALAFYMINLWVRSWHEVPCGSLEDDDDVLSDAAMCDLKTWGKVRDRVLRGWTIKDGRIYHNVVAELAKESWDAKQKQRQRTEAARQARLLARNSPVTGAGSGATESVTSPVTEAVTTSVTEAVTGPKGREGKGDKGESANADSQEEEEDARANSNEMPTSVAASVTTDVAVNRPRADASNIVAAWNIMASRAGLPPIKRLTEKRKNNISARIRDHGEAGVLEAIGKIGASQFCGGANSKNWKADFDFLLTDTKLTSAREGKYDDRKSPPGLWDDPEPIESDTPGTIEGTCE